MTTTVEQLLHQFSAAPLISDVDSSISRKAWTARYPDFGQFSDFRVYEPTVEQIERFLGPRDQNSSADRIGLFTPAEVLNVFPQKVETEADVTRYFDQAIASFALAFSGTSALTLPTPGSAVVQCGPLLWPRSQVGPADSSSSKTVDYQLVMPHSESLLELPAIIGEMKKPNTIIPNQWNPGAVVGAVTETLQKELTA